jgi:hypothetical protein
MVVVAEKFSIGLDHQDHAYHHRQGAELLGNSGGRIAVTGGERDVPPSSGRRRRSG